MLLLSAIDTAPYDYYSTGDGSNPIAIGVVLDGTGGTVTSGVLTAYLVASDYGYSNIVLQPISEQAGVDWQLSLDNAAWGESISPAGLDATGSDQSIPVYLRVVANNDGSINTGYLAEADIEITRTEIL